MQLKQHNGGARWNANLMDNGVRPSGMLVVKDGTGNGNTTLTEEQREQVLQSYADHMSGPDNAGVPFIAEGGLEWQEMSMNPKDLDWLEGMRDAARLICLVVNIPPLILNIPGDNTFKNYGEAREAAYMDGAIPLMEELVAELNTDLVPAFGDNIRLALDLDKVEALAAWRAERMKNVDLCSFMMIDEKRATVGLDELPDGAGKHVMVSSSMIPLAMAIEPPEPPVNENVDENGDPIPPVVGGKKPKPGKPIVVPAKKPADGKALETLFKRLAE
jgi:HK97 family phage portal protein